MLKTNWIFVILEPKNPINNIEKINLKLSGTSLKEEFGGASPAIWMQLVISWQI